MKLNTPLPQPLSKECEKAAKIFQSFVDSRNNGLDGAIPRAVLQNAKGFAIFTVVKAGFVFSARAGSGVVIARLEDGRWSAPSAIGTAGVGVGGQVGAEVTDFLVVLNTRAAIRSFMAAGSLTLGGNLSIALGPLGRNGEAIGSVSSGGKVAAMYSYSKTRGLFGGISIEGSVIVERQDANAQAYSSPVTVRMLLSGMVNPPSWAEVLVKTLDSCTGMPGTREWIHDEGSRSPDPGYAFARSNTQPSPPSGSRSRTPSFLRKKKEKVAFPPPHWGMNKDGGSYFSDGPSTPTSYESDSRSANPFERGVTSGPSLQRHSTYSFTSKPIPTSKTDSLIDDLDDPFSNGRTRVFTSTSRPHVSRSTSLGGGIYGYNTSHKPEFSRDKGLLASNSHHVPGSAHTDDNDLYSSSPVDSQRKPSQHSYINPKPQLTRLPAPGEGVARAIALFDFKAVENGDLSFEKGEIIIVTKKSDSTDDWWTGRVHNREGIFPANFVEVV